MTAILSDCGNYRYRLARPGDFASWKNPVVFVMLNPSTADATEDDPTIRRCRNFAREWGCDGVVVVNLYAWRSSNPQDLWRQSDPIGPGNDEHIAAALNTASMVVVAWGANAEPNRAKAVFDLIRASGPYPESGMPLCLGTTGRGHPRHPLYVKQDQPLRPWSPEEMEVEHG